MINAPPWRSLGVEMFGSNNNNNQAQSSSDNSQPGAPPAGSLSTFNMDSTQRPTASPSLPPEPTGSPVDDATSAPHVDNTPPANDDQAGPSDNGIADDVPSSLPPAQELSGDNDDAPSPGDDKSNDDLLAIKTQALSQLSPLVNHLDQSPEDKFKTLMMMIQASDNQSLIKDAYKAAEQITDDKAKSQALLDVINEINYFTQDKSKD